MSSMVRQQEVYRGAHTYAVQLIAVQYNVTGHGTVWYDGINAFAVMPRTMLYPHRCECFGMELYGIIWYGMVWYGMAWYDMV